MSKLFQAFLTGIFFTFILDFFLFLGIFQNYIKLHEIDVYYNILFADNQNIFIFMGFSILIGFLVIYINNNRITATILATLFLLISLTLIESVGESVGQMLLMKKDKTIQWKSYTYHGDIYYDDRESLSFYDYKLDKIILLNKKEIQE